MKKTPSLSNNNFLVWTILLLLLFIAFSYYNEITGSFVGSFSVYIKDTNNYFANNVTISNYTIIDTGLNITLAFSSDAVSTGFLNITIKDVNPTNNTFSEKASLNKFMVVKSNISFDSLNLTLSYNESELGNIDENSLRIYHFNTTTGEWDILSGGVDTNLNKVYAIVYNFSIFGVFGNSVQQPSGSGGGSAIEIKSDFTVTPDIITTSLLQENGKGLDLQIENTGNEKIDMEIELENLTEFAIISERYFVLDVRETKLIRLDLFALSETKPDIYIGKIIIRGGSVQKIVSVIIEVKERKPLFDISVSLLPEYKIVSAGKNIFALVQLENIGLRGKLMDVYLKLLITDLDKKILFESSKESIAVGTQLSTIRELNIPSYMPSGKYMLIAETSYDNTTIDAYDTFDIVEETTEEVVKEVTEEKTISTPGISLSDFLVVGFSVAIIIVCVMVFLLYREIKGLQIIYPVKSGKEIERERKKLKRKLKILKESFREGFINKEEYKKRKNEIKDKFEKLDKELERIKEEKIEYTEGELAVFRKEKNKLIDELKRLDKAYSLGVIDRKGYERTKNVINKKIDKLKEELGEF